MITDTSKIHLMPLIMRLSYDQESRPDVVYSETESLILQYQTDPDAIPPLLPDCYQPGSNPLVSVAISYHKGVDFNDGSYPSLAGNGYRVATIQLAARYDGEEDHLDGDYILVMFVNDAMPIIMGRELVGIPKLYADISPVKIPNDGHLRCDISLWGHLLFGVDLGSLEKQNADVCRAASERSTKWPRFCYKYIASLGGPPDADYPIVLYSDVTTEQLWIGKIGELYFGNSSENDIGMIKSIVDALKSLPVHSITQTIHSRGSQILRWGKCHKLR